jgi:D-psicose/D-tagatose/L-ribulose 3-epimerase
MTPRFGAHAFLWVDEWTIEKGNYAIAAAGKAGFDFIEIPLLKPGEFNPDAHKPALAAADIGATASLVLPNDAQMPYAPQKAMDFLISALDKLAVLGGYYLCGCIAFALGVFTGVAPTGAERQIVIDCLKEISAEAEERGIKLGFEVVNRYEGYLYNTLAEACETIRVVGSDYLTLHADTYHMNIEEEGFYQPLIDSSDVLGYMHMSESHRGLVGSGTVNWEDVFRGLADANYKGPLVLESFAAINPDLQAATKLWRPTNQPSDVLASAGLKVLKQYADRYHL